MPGQYWLYKGTGEEEPEKHPRVLGEEPFSPVPYLIFSREESPSKCRQYPGLVGFIQTQKTQCYPW